MKRIDQLQGDVHITPADSREPKQKIKRLEINEAERVLGIRQALNGQYQTEYEYRRKQSNILAGKLSRRAPGRVGAEMIYQQRWRPAITYCTPVANLTKSQCDKIQSPFYQVLLPMMGFNRHMPRAVIFGPKWYGGRGIMDLYTETNIQHIDTITRHLRYGTTCGNAALISAEVYQVFLGIELPFLESNATKYLHRDKSQWLDYVWEFCTKSDLTIKLSQVWNQKKQFPRDAALMKILYETEGIPTSLAKSINRCRLWLKVK